MASKVHSSHLPLRSQRSPKPSKPTSKEHSTPHVILRYPRFQQTKMLATRFALRLQRRVHTDGDQPVDPREHNNPRERQTQQRARRRERPQTALTGEGVGEISACQRGGDSCGHDEGATGVEDVGEDWG